MPENTQIIVDDEARQLSSQYEDEAQAEVTTGDLLETVAGGVQPHSTAAGVVDRVLVAIADAGRGMEQGDSYPAGDNTHYRSLRGGRVHLRLAAGESVTADDDGAPTRLVSAGDGTVRAFDGAGGDTDNAVVAVADETVDNSGGGEAVYVAVEVVA